MSPSTNDTIHEKLLRRIIRVPLTEDDALLWMALLHTHSIRLSAPIEEGEPGSRLLAATTQRHAASVIASLWPQREDKRASYEYWYRQYQLKTPYESMSQIPQDQAARLAEMRDDLLKHPLVEVVVEEEQV